MTIEANAKNIEWLIEKLYLCRRELQATEAEHPVFVLLTKGPDERDKVEAMFWRYVQKQYGGLITTDSPIQPCYRTQRSTRINLASVGASILLVDLSL